MVATPEDLYIDFDNTLYDKQFEIGKGLLIYDFMNSWTLQSGYPVLNAEKNETDNKFYLTQVIIKNKETHSCIILSSFKITISRVRLLY